METTKPKRGIRELHVRNRKAWRKWLENNHAKEKSVRLVIYHKNSSKRGLTYEEAVEEALCFGWIDSKTNSRDGESFFQMFARRNPKSNWSQSNRQRVEKLIEQGLMTAPGLELVELAKRTGTWTALDATQDLVVPHDLQEAFNKKRNAMKNWEKWTPSSRRMILTWIASAKRPETRQKRIDETVSLAAKNIKPLGL